MENSALRVADTQLKIAVLSWYDSVGGGDSLKHLKKSRELQEAVEFYQQTVNNHLAAHETLSPRVSG